MRIRQWLADLFGKRNTLRYSINYYPRGQVLTTEDLYTREIAQAIKEHATRLLAAPVGTKVPIGWDLWAVRTGEGWGKSLGGPVGL